jgi:hypothetical protein
MSLPQYQLPAIRTGILSNQTASRRPITSWATRFPTSSVYRESISHERLRAITEHVRGWVFGCASTTNQEDHHDHDRTST